MQATQQRFNRGRLLEGVFFTSTLCRPNSSFSQFVSAQTPALSTSLGKPFQQASVPPSVLSPSTSKRSKNLLSAAGLITTGLLLHRLPERTIPMVKTFLPVDWKVWARVVMGIFAVNRINKAFDWQPPPWLGGLQAVSIITPVASKFTVPTLKQMLKIAPLVAVIVQAASELNKRVTDPIKETLHIPPFVTRIGISVVLALAGLKFSKLLGISAAGLMTCARGCSPGSIICLSELGEMASGMKSWAVSKKGDKNESQTGRIVS